MGLDVLVTAGVTLLAVVIGGWLSTRSQERLWRREHDRHWRDIRLKAYTEFLDAFRHYVAYALEPGAQITSVPHPKRPGEMMPFFREDGVAYRERFEAAKTALRIVALRAGTVHASSEMVLRARRVAAARSTYAADAIPDAAFDELWSAERVFVEQVRRELDLPDFDGPISPYP